MDETRVVPISQGVYAFDQEMVRCFLILGTDRALLLDTGAVPCNLRGMIAEITKLPVTVVHTHGDGDHTAGDNQFSEIYAHPGESSVIYRFCKDPSFSLLPISKGMVFDLGGRRLEVLETPGHTPGSICLLDRDNRILFSGDTVSYGPVFLFGGHRDIRLYRRTLYRLMQISSAFETVYPCHGPCPAPPSVLWDLASAVDGALDGTIQGTPCQRGMPDGSDPLVYTYGACSIYYIPK